MAEDFGTGRFVWYDLMTTDPAGAVKFYTELIGWGTQEWDAGEMPYTMWSREETSIGGLMALPPEAAAGGVPPHWIPYVAVPDLAATVARAKELGAEIVVEPQEIPDNGSFATLADPQGAAFSVYTPEGDEAGGHDGPREVQEFSWHELMTTDYEAALTFYTELFGWKKGETMDMGEAGIYQMYGRTELPLGGMYNKHPHVPQPMWLLYIRVPDVATAAAKVQELGGEVLIGPIEVPGGDHIIQCRDPQGATFALHSVG